MQEIEKHYHLNQTINILSGFSKEQIIVFNQWAATALNSFHTGSIAHFEFKIDGKSTQISLQWDSNFPAAGMRERKQIAENGAIALTLFAMSVLSGYKYAFQTEIGEGVDYCFKSEIDSPENFLSGGHYVEISGLLEEKGSNTLLSRIKIKHAQIEKGDKHGEKCSIAITLFSQPIVVMEAHLWI